MRLAPTKALKRKRNGQKINLFNSLDKKGKKQKKYF